MSTVWKVDTTNDGPKALAWRMAGYNRDANYIRAMVMRDHGTAPTTSEIKSMIETHHRRREKFKRNAEERGQHESGAEYDGEDYAPRVIGYQPKVRVSACGKKYEVVTLDVASFAPPQNYQDPMDVMRAVAEAFKTTTERMRSELRATDLVAARAVYCKIMHDRDPKRYSHGKLCQLLKRSCPSSIRNLLITWPQRCKRFPAMREVYRAMGGAE